MPNETTEREDGYEEEAPPITSLQKDVELCIRRLRTKANAVEENGAEVTSAEVLRELYANVLPMLYDLIPYIDRLEEHAAWASEEIQNLSDMQSNDEAASQLAPSDADRFLAFFQELVAEIDAKLADLDPDSDEAKSLGEKKTRALELIETTGEIRLEDPSPDTDEGQEIGEA